MPRAHNRRAFLRKNHSTFGERLVEGPIAAPRTHKGSSLPFSPRHEILSAHQPPYSGGWASANPTPLQACYRPSHMRNITSLSFVFLLAGFVGCSAPDEGDQGAPVQNTSDEASDQKQPEGNKVAAEGVVEEPKAGDNKTDEPDPVLLSASASESPSRKPAGVSDAKEPEAGTDPDMKPADADVAAEETAAADGDWSKGDTIPSGMQGVPAIQILEVHKNGSGDACGMGKTATLKYKAMLADGKVIDPGTRPFSFKVGAGRAIKGWDVVVSKMRVGDSFTIMLPMKLAYGPSKGDLKFDMELISVK